MRLRKRVSAPETISSLQHGLGFELLDLPAEIWADLERLPVLHRDPMDRMLVSHARLAKLTLVTADATLRRYPVDTLW